MITNVILTTDSMISQKKRFYDLLTRGVEKIIVQKNVEAQLKKDAKLNLKLGIDPTGIDIHIGHMVVVRKLRAFQALGHRVTIIVGDYTARIGDPSSRDKMREPLTKEQVMKNMETYQEQLNKILDTSKTSYAYQSEWFDDVTLTDILEWAGMFTVQQMLDRDMYQKRIKEGAPIGLHEFLYPLMQGYDSVAIKADIEFGGSDQEFNLLVGRAMQEKFRQTPQNIITTPLLLGTDGRKMSKTYGNYIGVTDSPDEMFGKIMSSIDEVIVEYFTLCTDVPTSEIEQIEREMKKGTLNPKDAKVRLAREIVTIYHGAPAAQRAEAEFEKVFKNREKPTEIREWKAKKDEYAFPDLLNESGLVSSKSEAKRVIAQGGVKINDIPEKKWEQNIKITKGMVIQVGKRRFVKIV